MNSLTEFYKCAQARTCNKCLYYVNRHCQKSVGVQARHGNDALKEWIKHPNSVNSCHYFAAVDKSDKRKDLWESGYHNQGALYGGGTIY
jgi:hypothetical protein